MTGEQRMNDTPEAGGSRGAGNVPGGHSPFREIPVRLFGPLSDCAESPVTVTTTLPVQVADLRAAILDAHPGFDAVRWAIAVNGRICADSEILDEVSEIALLPPFAGG